MCIIAYSPTGAGWPSKKQFKTMFKHNPDGAGFMTTSAAGVVVKKGFMTYSEFRQALSEYKPVEFDRPFIFHFRIATHGGINPEMTQPFPLSNSNRMLKSLDGVAAVGIAHNGIIPVTTDARKMSDTAYFIRDYMTRIYDSKRGFDDITLNIIEACIQSKMAILESGGRVHILGRGWKKDGQLYFSNDSYIDYYTRSAKKKKRKAANWESLEDYGTNWCTGECGACPHIRDCWGPAYSDGTLYNW